MVKVGKRPCMYWYYLLDKQGGSFFLSGLWHGGEQSAFLAPQGGDLKGEDRR